MKNLFVPFIVLFIATGVYGQKYISNQQAMKDLDFFNQTLVDVHFNPFLFVKKEKYLAEVVKIKASIKDSIKVEDFIIELYKLTSLMEDSHSGPSLFQSELFGSEYKKEQFFPLHTIINSNRLYVSPKSEFPSGIEPGSEITSINGKDIGLFLKEAQGLMGGIPEYKKEFTNRLLSHFLFISGIKAPFDIEYKDPSSRILRTNVLGSTYVKSLLVTMPGLLKGNSFKIIDGKLGYLDFCNMNGDWQKFGQFIDSAMNTFKAKNIKYLAIDLRNNSGGNSMLADVLISYLTDKKYRLMGIKKWKVSQQYKDYLSANGNTGHNYLSLKNGEIWEQGNCEPQSNNFTSDNKFEGKVYFLTGPFTFSSANMLASGVKQYQLAEIIGEPTGENTNDFGEVYSFKLPNSKVVMNITTSFDIGPNCDNTISAPVIPDILIQNSLDNLLKGEDKVLEYVLEKAK